MMNEELIETSPAAERGAAARSPAMNRAGSLA
jgi:hypothetical protein